MFFKEVFHSAPIVAVNAADEPSFDTPANTATSGAAMNRLIRSSPIAATSDRAGILLN